MTTTLESLDAARLLRELADEVLIADGAARNGLFLELHRLLDTIFRLALESHPDATPEEAASAFSLVESLPAPQVVRLLHGLESPLVTLEIRKLYKHMNAARNNLAHEAVVARVVVSRANVKRMAQLAHLLADQLDPAQSALPALSDSDAPRPRAAPPSKLIPLVLGLLSGAALLWAWFLAENFALALATTTIVLTLIGALFLLD